MALLLLARQLDCTKGSRELTNPAVRYSTSLDALAILLGRDDEKETSVNGSGEERYGGCEDRSHLERVYNWSCLLCGRVVGS
jgi:hypothetical protein